MGYEQHNGLSVGGEVCKPGERLDRLFGEAERAELSCAELRTIRVFTACGGNAKRDAAIMREYFGKGLERMEAAGVGEVEVEWPEADWRVSGFINAVFFFVADRYHELVGNNESIEKTATIQVGEIRAFLDSREDGPGGRSYKAMTPAGLKHGWRAAEVGEFIVLGIFAAESEWTGAGAVDFDTCDLYGIGREMGYL